MGTATATRPTAPAAAGTGGGNSPLTGTWAMARFILRRDRIRLPIWIVALTIFTIRVAESYPHLLETAADRQLRADLIGSPGFRLITGPAYGLDDYTFGAIMGHEVLGRVGILITVMAILLMVRHTRREEESGRAELFRSAVVGRHAQTTAALVVVGSACVLIGVLTALGLGAIGIESITWAGSWLYGAAVASIGVVFAAVTAVTAQLTQHARAAGGLAGAILAVSFVIRGTGDAAEIGGGPLSWASPVGWAQQTRVYVDDRWWPLLVPVAITVALVALAFWLSTRRDIGAGIRPPRLGAASASALLASPLGLAWRQQRAGVIGWGVAVLLFGMVYGAITDEMETFVDELAAMEDWMAQIGGETIIDSSLAALVLLLAVCVSIFAVLAVLRPRGEETAGRVEPVLATAVSRTRWVISHLTVTLAGSAFILALGGLGLGITAAAVLGDASVLTRLLGAAVAYTPAIWVTVGLGVALFGLVPRASVVVWLVIAYAGVVGVLEAPLGLPDGLANLSPFTHVPMLPAEEMNWVPLLVLTGVAAGLAAAGLLGFRRRDLETK